MRALTLTTADGLGAAKLERILTRLLTSEPSPDID